jgi:hypothetical protein
MDLETIQNLKTICFSQHSDFKNMKLSTIKITTFEKCLDS